MKNPQTVSPEQNNFKCKYQFDIYICNFWSTTVCLACVECGAHKIILLPQERKAQLKSRVVGADVEEKKHHNSSRKPYRGWPQSPDSPPGGTTLG